MNFTKENKVQMYYDRLNGDSFSQLSLKYNVSQAYLIYTFKLIELHGEGIVLSKKIEGILNLLKNMPLKEY